MTISVEKLAQTVAELAWQTALDRSPSLALLGSSGGRLSAAFASLAKDAIGLGITDIHLLADRALMTFPTLYYGRYRDVVTE